MKLKNMVAAVGLSLAFSVNAGINANDVYIKAVSVINSKGVLGAAENDRQIALARSAAQENQRNQDAYISISGYLQEAMLLNQTGRSADARNLLAGRFPERLEKGMQAEFLYVLATITYGSDPREGLALFNKAIEVAPTAELKEHFSNYRDVRLGHPVAFDPSKHAVIVE